MSTLEGTNLGSGARLEARTRAAALVGFAVFIVVSVLVQTRVFAGLDAALLHTVRDHLVSRELFRVSNVASLMATAGVSVVFAVVAILALLRAGVGNWSLAPAVFLISVPAELLMKLVVEQPPLPGRFGYQPDYPQSFEDSIGTYPSGHAIRASFFCVFFAIILWRRGGAAARAAAIALGLLAVAIGLARVYQGVHWPSDVLGGLVLGASLALLVAPPVAVRVLAHSR